METNIKNNNRNENKAQNREFEDAQKDFINYCLIEKGLSGNTKKSYLNDLKIYKQFLNIKYHKNIILDNICETDIESFLKEQIDKKKQLQQ